MVNVRKVPFEPRSEALCFSTMCTCKSLHVFDIKPKLMIGTQGTFAYSHTWKYMYWTMGANVYSHICQDMHTHVCVGVLPLAREGSV